LLGVTVITMVLFFVPLVIYASGRINGSFTTPEDWFTVRGNNHGPWRETNYQVLVGLLLLALIPTTAAVGVWRAVRQGRNAWIPGTGFIISLQAACLVLQLRFLFWLID
jgi:ACR3 family arsenite efflux pump ArsB